MSWNKWDKLRQINAERKKDADSSEESSTDESTTSEEDTSSVTSTDSGDTSVSKENAAETDDKDYALENEVNEIIYEADPEMEELRNDIYDVMDRYIQTQKELDELNAALTKQQAIFDLLDDQALYTDKLLNAKCQLVWKIDEFRSRLQRAASGKKTRDTVIFSPEFTTHYNGYKLGLSLCPFGDGVAKGEYMSLYFCILKSEYDSLLSWPFAVPLTFTLLDTNPDQAKRKHVTKSVTPLPNKSTIYYLARPLTFRNPSIGILRFVKIKELFVNDGRQYLKEDNLYIRIDADLDDVVLC